MRQLYAYNEMKRADVFHAYPAEESGEGAHIVDLGYEHLDSQSGLVRGGQDASNHLLTGLAALEARDMAVGQCSNAVEGTRSNRWTSRVEGAVDATEAKAAMSAEALSGWRLCHTAVNPGSS